MDKLDRDRGGWTLRFETSSDLQAAVSEVAARGGGRLTAWYSGPTPATDELAASVGFSPGRDLLQLRRPLPVESAGPRLETRPFAPGRDEQRWLEVNNRAFASHPEQGGWTLADIAAREREPWFDPAGFLLHEVGGKLAAFCWTKVHGDHDPPLGEIYVVAVDPSFAGTGLGRTITVAGLVHLASRGITVAMLYVDATNVAARALYDHLGFTIHHTDRSYVAQAPPDTPTSAPIP